MALTAAELRAVYSVDEGPLDKSLGGLGGKVKGAIGGAVGAAAGLFAFGAISGGFTSLTTSASDLNETMNKSSVIFGANAAQIDQWATGAATNLGLSKQQALAAAAGFGDMFSQIGFAGDEATDMSKSVVQMSADLGSFNNLDTADVADRMSAAFRGEYDSLQALIPNINGARVESEAMAATGKKVASELTAQEKAAAVLAIVNKDGARAMGDFAKTSEGSANATKIATAQWEDQKAVIGQSLLPILNSLLSFVSGSLIPGISAGFETARQAVSAFTGAWQYNDGDITSSGFNGYMERLGYIARQTADVLGELAGFISDNREPITIVAGLIATLFIPHLVALGVASLVAGVQSVAGWVMGSAAAVAAGVVHSAQVVAMIARWVLLSGAAILNGALVVGAWVGMGVAAAVQAGIVVAAWVGAQISAVASLAVMAAGFVVQGAVMVASAAVTAAGVVAGWVLMGTQAMLQAARMAAAWLIAMGPIGWAIAAVIGIVALIIANWEAVKGATIAAWNAVSGAVSGAWTSVTSAVSAGVSSVITFVTGLPGRILTALGNLGSLLYDKGGDLLGGFVRGITSSVTKVATAAKNAAKAAVSAVTDFLGIKSPSRVFMGIGANVGKGFVQGIEGMRPAVAAEMMRLADTSALSGLTARPPALAAGAGASVAAAAAIAGDGGRGPLFHADTVTVIEGTPDDVARQLELGARTRGTW